MWPVRQVQLVVLFQITTYFVAPAEHLDDDQCGVPHYSPIIEPINIEQRIIGGNEARKNSWPWQVSIRRKGPDGVFRHACGGTLVSRTKIISAAHCLMYSDEETDYDVQLGAHILSEANNEGVVKISKIVVPYPDNVKKQEFPSDITVITLADPVRYGDKILPACFDSVNIDLSNVPCYAIGWGKNVSFYSTVTSNYLKQTRAPVHKQEDCQKYIGSKFNADLMMCAGILAGGSDTCQGDSGGPLICNVYEKWRLYGVVNFGTRCAVRNSPTVYAKVKAHWKFLQEAMKN